MDQENMFALAQNLGKVEGHWIYIRGLNFGVLSGGILI